jgi:hypothetical protein
MATKAQTNANRKNAAISTGPRTKAGKDKSSQNATKHGGYAERDIAIQRGRFKEDPDEVFDLVDGIMSALDPRDELEREEAGGIAMIYLRLRRISRFEALSMNGVEGRPRRDIEDYEYVINGYDSIEQAHRIKDEEALIFGSEGLLEGALTTASRVDAQNSRSLDRAMRRYYLLRSRTIDEGGELDKPEQRPKVIKIS